MAPVVLPAACALLDKTRMAQPSSPRRTALLCLALGACAGPAPVSVERVVERIALDVDLSGTAPDVLELRFQQGHALVVPGAELRCELIVEIPARSAREATVLRESLRMSPRGDTPARRVVAVEPPPDLPLADLYCSYRLTVPADVRLEVATARGDVTLRGFAGEVGIRTESGRIRAELGGGRAEVHNRSGHTRLGGSYHAAHVVTDGGAVVAALPDARAPHGAVRGELSFESRSGAVKLLAARDEAIELVFATGSGAVLSDLPIRWLSREAVADHVRSVGRVGASEAPGTRVLVTSRTGDLEVAYLRRDDAGAGAHTPVAGATP